MSNPVYTIKPALRCLRRSRNYTRCLRSFTTIHPLQEAALQATSPTPTLDPALVSKKSQEEQLISQGIQPIGSRRRRAALRTTTNIPFEQLPYQCFQEARKILLSDREEKLELIEEERKRIARLEARNAAECGGEVVKRAKLIAMRKYLEHLKIMADINDPMIKKRFEDGDGIRCMLLAV